MGQRKKVRGFEPHLPSSYKNGKIIQKIQRALNFYPAGKSLQYP